MSGAKRAVLSPQPYFTSILETHNIRLVIEPSKMTFCGLESNYVHADCGEHITQDLEVGT